AAVQKSPATWAPVRPISCDSVHWSQPGGMGRTFHGSSDPSCLVVAQGAADVARSCSQDAVEPEEAAAGAGSGGEPAGAGKRKRSPEDLLRRRDLGTRRRAVTLPIASLMFD